MEMLVGDAERRSVARINSFGPARSTASLSPVGAFEVEDSERCIRKYTARTYIARGRYLLIYTDIRGGTYWQYPEDVHVLYM